MKVVMSQCSALMARLRTAIHLFRCGFDISHIARWLGHESQTTTHHYVVADLPMKDRALQRIREPHFKQRRYGAPDQLLEFLRAFDYG